MARLTTTAQPLEMRMNDDELSALIHQQATRFQASGRLRADLRTRVALEAAAHPIADATPAMAGMLRDVVGRKTGGRWREFGWRTAAAGFALGVALTTALTMTSMPHGSRPAADLVSALDAELVANHVRSLRVGPLIQVASTDRHTVKPWFQGKLDYAPPVLNLAGEGFSLVGGRVEHVNGESVATLVYTHNQHVLNLFVWPSTVEQATQRVQRQGFNVLHWSNGAMQCWLVSDMDPAEVERFGQLWREQLARL